MALSVLLISGHEFVGINAFLFVSLILCCLLLGGLIKRYKFTYLPESAASMIFGFICGGFLNLTSTHEKSVLEFSPELIFFAVLPPIILDAGYTLKRKAFFRNLGTILLLAVVGTVLNNLVFGYLLFGFAKAGWIPLDANNPLECLLFGAVVSATDPVATLAILGNKEVGADPLLYSLVFGESVLNDAIAIVLYKTFEAALPSAGDADGGFGSADLLRALGTFIGVSIGSILVGVSVALLCCFIFKQVNMSRFPVYEFTLVTLFAYLSYFLAEMAYLSGILSIFICAVCLAHYNLYNLSTNAQIATQEAFKSIAHVCETFVFGFLGITAGLSIKTAHLSWSFPMIILTIVSCLVARAANVFPICALANMRRAGGLCTSRCGRNAAARTRVSQLGQHISLAMQVPLWFAGLRGAIAFALSLSFNGPHVKYVVSSTLMLVLFTTIIGGSLTLPVLRWSGMSRPSGARRQSDALPTPVAVDAHDAHGSSFKFELLEDNVSSGAHGHGEDEGSSSDEEEESKQPHSHGAHSHLGSPAPVPYRGLVARFKQFDKVYMRRWFGGAPTARGRFTGTIDENGVTVHLSEEETARMMAEPTDQQSPRDHDHADAAPEIDMQAVAHSSEPALSDLAGAGRATAPMAIFPAPNSADATVPAGNSIGNGSGNGNSAAAAVRSYNTLDLDRAPSPQPPARLYHSPPSSYRQNDNEVKSIFTQALPVGAGARTPSPASASLAYKPPAVSSPSQSPASANADRSRSQ